MQKNLHTVAVSAGILGVECRACGRRAALEKSEKLDISRGSMTTLVTIKLKCSKCGARGTGQSEFQLYIPHDLNEAKEFLAGEPLENRKV